MKLPKKICCDGGIIGPRNPSVIGGTWAWAWVDENDCLMKHDYGAVTPGVMGAGKVVTNNQTELLAACTALASVPEGWDGTLCTDSLVTLYRVTDGEKFANIPGWLEARARGFREGRKYKVKLVAGHPTKAELLSGARKRNGLPTSHWNVFCDGLCRKAGEAFLNADACGR